MKLLKCAALRPSAARPLNTETPKLLPLAAMMLAGSMGISQPAQAQSEEKTLKTVTVTDTQDPNLSKESLLIKQTGIAKGNQQIKDIPQTVTVMTEKLMADRNLDDFREVLKTTAGVTFQAGETGEEDVRMRGFSLGQAGDIYVDGLRDAPLIERDTFNTDRVEVLKGSASMLFGKGSTGGVVNQVNKQPFLMDQNEVNVTVGSGEMRRVTLDMNKQTGESAALRLNAMTHQADNWGAKVDKKGVAGAYRWGIGERDEYTAGLYHLETDGRPLYNHPWVLSDSNKGTIIPVLSAKNYYGLASDYLRTQSSYGSFTHKHRFDAESELKTTFRQGHYERDLWTHAIGFCNSNASTTGNNAAAGWAQRAACAGQGTITSASQITDNTVLTRTSKARRGISDVTQAQSDYNDKFTTWGLKHDLMAGLDFSKESAKRNNNAASAALYNTSATSTATANVDPAYTTWAGTPNDGETRKDTRNILMMGFNAQVIGAYAQDTVSLSDTVKALGGLRVDQFSATFTDTVGYTASVDKTLFSPRLGAIWQPNDVSSYYTSYGTSFNTSADAYAYALSSGLSPTVNGQRNSNLTTLATPPEKSRNLEVGGKFDVFDKKGLFGVALFYSEKYNERNTDTDSAGTQYLLSGKRHATGMEFNFAGRITPAWEVFYNHTWIPQAKIDDSSIAATGDGAQGKGDRPALTPKHSASLWSTYRFNTAWRVGGGLNYRDEQNPEGARTKTAAAFTTADVMAEYALDDANLLKLNVSNLTNKLYADTLYRGFYGPGAPRRIELSWKSMF